MKYQVLFSSKDKSKKELMSRLQNFYLVLWRVNILSYTSSEGHNHKNS